MSKKRKRVLLICMVLILGAVAYAFYGGALRFVDNSDGITLYFIRHGQTDTNVAGLLVGTSGNPTLTDTGREMAFQLGEGLKDVCFDAAYSSTLMRAYDTASLILEAAGQDDIIVTQLDGLKDISWGDAEGMTSEDLYENFGISTTEEAFGTIDDSDFVSPIHAESKHDFCERFGDAVNEIIEMQEEGDTVLIAAHSSMDFFFETYFPEQAGDGVDNLSVTILRYDDDEFTLVEYNNMEYLSMD